jgi:hypothetical protein
LQRDGLVGRVIRIALAALVVYAVWQTGAAYWSHLQLQDRIDRLAQFSAGRSEDEVRAAVVAEAVAFGARLDPADVAVRLSDNRLTVHATYSRRIEPLPRVPFNWALALDTEVWLLPPAGVPRR